LKQRESQERLSFKDFVKMDLLSELQHAEFKEAFDEFDKVIVTPLLRKISALT